jgi:hypothetical protein
MESIVTLDWAKEWFTVSRPKADEWNNADDSERQKYLNWASSLIRSTFTFPNDFVPENNDRVRMAVCEQSLWLMRRPDAYPEVLTMGLSQASAGPLSATFSKDFIAPLICESTVSLIGELGELSGTSSGLAVSKPLWW